MRDDSLGLSLLASFFIHGAALILASIILKHTVSLRREDFLPVSLVDVPRQEQAKPIEKIPPLPPPKIEKAKKPEPPARSEIVSPKPAPPPSALLKEEPVKPVEAKPVETTKSEPTPALAPTARVEGGGSEAGAGNLFDKGDVAVVLGSGTSGGGGGTAIAGLGKGSGDPGLPAQSLAAQNQPGSQADSNRPCCLSPTSFAHGNGERRHTENRNRHRRQSDEG
ncbi:MAG TPA: hypothetical protein VLJ79_07135 [Candidatus Binatia bacterium]|nr:hypothetical protein [Candidatus Binatia bacterium]